MPSFGRTYRTNSITQADAEDAAPGPSLYRILPQDVSQPAALVHIKQKLESLHPSQRDYVFAQLLDEVSAPAGRALAAAVRLTRCAAPTQEGAYLRRLFALFEDLDAQLAAAEKTASSTSVGAAARSQETVVKVFAQRADGVDADADDGAEAQRSPTETETEGLFSATTTVHSAGATQQSADDEAAASDAADRARSHSAPQLREWLRQLADILRQIVLLNDPTLIEYLLSDEVFAFVAGVFEHDRALRSRGDYRDFLFRRARLVEVVALQSDVRSTAKFLFRLRFLKDVMLHPTIDEPGITALNSMIVFTSCEIAAKLLDDAAFCAALLRRVASDDAGGDGDPAATDTQALALLRETLQLSTFLSLERRQEAVDAFLRRHGADFAAALTREFLRQLWPAADAPPAAEGDRGLQLAAEALLLVAQTQPSQLRRLLLSPAAGAQHPPPPALSVLAPSGAEAAADTPRGGWSLLLLLVDAVVNADDVVALELCAEALRLSLDFDRDALSALPAAQWSRGGAPAALSGEQRAEKERFLQLFYERYLPWLLAPFADAHDPAQPVPTAHYAPLLQAAGDVARRQRSSGATRRPQSRGALTASRRCVLELLCLCVSQHAYRAKYPLIRGNFLAKIVSKSLAAATQRRDRHTALGALRLLRAALRLKDEFYLRYVARADLLAELLRSVAAPGDAGRDNLFTAAVAELLELVRQERLLTLLQPLLERHGALLREALGRGNSALQELADGLQQAALPAARGDAEVAAPAARREDARQREIADEDAYFFGDRDADDAGDSDGDADEASACGVKRAVEALYSSDEDDAGGSVARRPPTAQLARPPSPPHYSHTPPLALSSAQSHLLHLSHLQQLQHDEPADDALQWLRRAYNSHHPAADDADAPLGPLGGHRGAAAAVDDDDDSFVEQLQRRKRPRADGDAAASPSTTAVSVDASDASSAAAQPTKLTLSLRRPGRS